MHLRIKKAELLFGIIVCACLFPTIVNGDCIICDSNNESEEDCGFVKDSLNPLVTTCTSNCFTRIYEKSDIAKPGWYTQRGCLGESDTCPEETCTSCEENNCNKELYPADRNKCLKCEGEACNAPKSEYCQVYLPDSRDCLTFFDQDGTVLLRSCYSDVPDATRELCDDSSYIDCKKCVGDNCNTATTRDGIKCHECSGVDCLIIETVSTVVDCRTSCYIGLNVNGKTVRGCASDFDNVNTCSSDELSSKDCFVCDEDNCNNIIYPQTNRLTCLTCFDGDCAPSPLNFEYCSNYNSNERCATVFSETANQVLARGCVSSLESRFKQTCDSNNANCLKCAYNNCNKDDSKLKTQMCIGCNSHDDIHCPKANQMTEVRCATSQCYSRLMEQQTENFGRFMDRGCLADLASASSCGSPDCQSCTGKNCNNKLFPQGRLTCKSCLGASCNGNEIDKVCSQYALDESCLTIYGEDNAVLMRECNADVPDGTREYCDDPTNLQCTKCKENLCNTDVQRRGNMCFKCEGINCVNLAPGSEVACDTECYVGVNQNGDPKRDCASSVENSSRCGASDLTCLTCTGDYCNGIVFPTENRLVCLKCSGEGCHGDNEPIVEYCERLSSTEKCVTIFDSAGSLFERGCSSSIQNSALCTTSNCVTCSFNECNVETLPGQKYHCISCNSNDDPKCISHPLETQVAACTTNQCFSMLLAIDGKGQQIQRGCADVQQGTGGTTCTGERCNANVFPSDRHSCYFCSGDHCALGHLQSKQCLIYNQQDRNCLTIYGAESEVIYRDCYIDSAAGTRALCDEKDLSCTKCVGMHCNNDTIRRGTRCLKCDGIDCFNANEQADSIDCEAGGCYVGLNANGDLKRDCAAAVTNSSRCAKSDTENNNCLVCSGDHCNAITYPIRNRLICKECLGESCDDNVLEDKYCERINSNERCVTVFNNADKILERGCSSTVQNTAVCSASNANCVKCAFNRCNVQNSKIELNHCVSCDSRDDPNCVQYSSGASTKTCASNRCYSRLLPISSGSLWQNVQKGCATDLGSSVNCTGASCATCTGDRCNNILYPVERISCHTCRNDECKNEVIPSNICRLHNSVSQACITLFNTKGEVSYRGCYSDAAAGTREVCDDRSQLLCTKCSGNSCNTANKWRGQRCFKCQGLDCFNANFPGDVVDCLSSCYVGINQQGETVRGCSSSFTNTNTCGADDDGINRCTVCNDDLCNGIHFPMTNRLQCQLCSGDDCEVSGKVINHCERYHGQERCVTVFSQDDRVIERGCSSSLRNQLYCNQNYENCLQCPSDACNSVTSKTSHLCVDCSSASDPNCVLNPTTIGSAKYCKKGCYTRLVGQTLHRGCYDDLATNFACVAENNCKFCNDIDKCNVEVYPSDRRSCKTCVGAGCNNASSQMCINYKSGDSCVTIFNQYNVARKGCLADQPTPSQALCTGSNVLCISCSSLDNCNTDMVRLDENCLSCSSALEPGCSQRPTNLPSQHCAVPSSGQCFARIMNGATVRGCGGLLSASEASNCRNNTAASQCTTTTGQGSNNNILPLNRRTCYQCDSRVDSTCLEAPKDKTNLLPCVKLSQTESCLKMTLSDATIIRGCVTDFSSDICQKESCAICDTDGCNSGALTRFSISCLLLAAFLFLRSMLS